MPRMPKHGRVKERDPDGKYASIEWIDEEGYRVVGDYKLIGWAQPPRAEAAKFHALVE